MKNKALITVLGWEDRFFEGIKYNFERFGVSKIYLFCYTEYADVTQKSFIQVQSFGINNHIEIIRFELQNSNALFNWKEIQKCITNILDKKDEIILDISTTPRETLWTILFFLRQHNIDIPFVYHKPRSYSEEWLSREPESPRLLFKHSGLMTFDRPTLLFIVTGFDSERINQLVSFYEPKKTVLLVQTGNQFNNELRNNKDVFRAYLKSETELEILESDSYDLENSYKKIKEILDPNLELYNIVATSLGPKISGLAIYQYQTEHNSIALSYVPCQEYNLEYSKGWQDAITGILKIG